MPQHDEPELKDIELVRFVNSDEWQKMLELVNEALEEWIGQCCDKQLDLEEIRYSQGIVEALKMFRDFPQRIFAKEKK